MSKIEWVGTSNFTPGRNGKKIIAIVNHITAGSYPGCLTWMQNTAAKASAHYLVTKTGKVLQLVKEGDTAWHAGVTNKPNWELYDGTNPNMYTLGIEHEGQPNDGLTEAQYQATLWLQKQLVAKYNILVDTDHIIGHNRIDSINRLNCPGPEFPWNRLFKDLKEEAKVAEKGKSLKERLAPDDTYLSVRVRESKVEEAIKEINKLGYACKRLDLA